MKLRACAQMETSKYYVLMHANSLKYNCISLSILNVIVLKITR